MNNLKITTIQTDLHWEDIDRNLSLFSHKISDIQEKTDVIVLPEMFNTGFSMNVEKLAESMEGKSVAWMREKAQQTNAVIVGSLIIEESSYLKKKYYNRLLWVQPDGSCYHYDKRHLFSMAKENDYFTPGNNRLVIYYKGWRICPLICYDLRFPVWIRNKTLSVDHVKCSKNISSSSFKDPTTDAYDCLIFIANWPAARRNHWCKLLIARAIENQAYVVGVNRVGIDGKGHNYSGDTSVTNPQGDKITKIVPYQENTTTIELSMEELLAYRSKFPVTVDADNFEMRL